MIRIGGTEEEWYWDEFNRRRRRMRPRKIINHHGGGTPAETTTTEVQDRFGTELGLSIDTSLLGMMLKESQAGVALTHPSANADLIGMIQDVSQNALIAYASADTVRAALGSDGTTNSYLTCDGTSDTYLIDESKTCFRNMVGTTPAYSIMIKFRKGASTDGTSQMLISSNGSTGGRTGINLSIDTNNKLVYFVTTNGAPNITMTTKTTSATYVEADGMISVVIDCSGAGGSNQLSIYKNNGTAETANVIVGYNQDFTDLITLFKNSNATTPRFKGDFAQLIILNRVSTAADRAWFQTFNPVRTTTLQPSNIYRHFDFTDKSKMYTERSSPTTNIVNNNDPVGYIKTQIETNMGGTLNRDGTAPSDAKRPLYKSAAVGVEWNGDSSLPEAGADMEINFNSPLVGGVFTIFITAQNLAVVEGRKLMSAGLPDQPATGGSSYLTFTSAIDASNSGYPCGGGPAAPTHIGGTPSAPSPCLVHTNDEKNTFCYVFDGGTLRIYNSLKVKVFDISITGYWGYRKFGGVTGSWTLSRWYEYIKYSGVLTEAQIFAKLDVLNAKHGT